MDKIRVFPGSMDLLAGLRHAGKLLALNTGKDRPRTEELLLRLSLSSFFDQVVTSDDVSLGKPHPESLLRILATTNSHPNAAVFVGDTNLDIQCARAAMVASIAASWGMSTELELRQSGPDYLVGSMDQLRQLLLGSDCRS